MSKLYIANATNQVRQFTYWLPEQPRAFMQEIPIGGQIVIASRDLPQSHIDAVLEQHQPYGLKLFSEALRSPQFSGIVYAIDRPVPYKTLYELVGRRRSQLTNKGKELRQQAAIATDDWIQDQMFRQQVPGRLEQLDMSVEEVKRDPRDDSDEVFEKVHVNHGDEDTGRSAPRRRAR